jgi:nucleotide-binding universal stress UspA family protein
VKSSLTQLLVHVDPSARSGDRLDLGLRIAQSQGAALTALYGVTPSFMAVPFSTELGAGVAASLHDIDDKQVARARASFDGWRGAKAASANWAQLGNDPVAGAFAQQALYADLMVLGQFDPTMSQPVHVPADFPEAVMAISGKPALIVPYIGAPATIAQTIVVAWKETPEAARAVSAAMPLLQRAERVHVVSWSQDESHVDGTRLDLKGYLALSGVDAVWHQEGREPERLGDLLLSRAFDLHADMLVMGCYGHSRAREWVLGGTSRTVLQSMTLPVLMVR